jgi:hypothetical protein
MDSFQNITDHFDGFGASPDGLGATVRVLGDDFAAPQPATIQPNPAVRALKIAYALAGVAGTAVGAYHGYKRNESVGWALGWAFLGGIFPVVVIPMAFAQGMGKRKGRGRDE